MASTEFVSKVDRLLSRSGRKEGQQVCPAEPGREQHGEDGSLHRWASMTSSGSSEHTAGQYAALAMGFVRASNRVLRADRASSSDSSRSRSGAARAPVRPAYGKVTVSRPGHAKLPVFPPGHARLRAA